jgi:putative cell wall-binding protein
MKKIAVVLILLAVICVSAFSMAACEKEDTIIVGYDNGFPPNGLSR